MTFVDNGNGTGTLSGTPAAGTAGSYAFTFTAANGTPPSAAQAFTLNVNQPPAITSADHDDLHRRHARHVHGDDDRLPGADRVADRHAAGWRHVHARRRACSAGTATQTGAFPLVFTATNGVPPDAMQNFTLNVVCPAITVNPCDFA